MKESNTQIELGIRQSFRAGRQSMHLDRFNSVSTATTRSPSAIWCGPLARPFDSLRSPKMTTTCGHLWVIN